MTDADLWAAWRFWMGIATAVILIAASLLILIWVTARGILAQAVRALRAAEEIQKNTAALWSLQTTNEAAERILERVQAIEQKGSALVHALEGQPAGRR